jgi:hypothetical protein
MRKRVWMACVLLVLMITSGASAQETRGNISGTVRDRDGVLPGAAVKIVNTETGVSQQLTTNSRGYFEAPLLIAGTYEVTVELASFKGYRQTGIKLSVGQAVPLEVTLELGQLGERVDVVANAAILDTNAVSSGMTFETRLISELPTFSSMPMLLIRNVSGVAASAAPQFATQGFVGGPSGQAGPLGGVGGTEYTIDGATNAGNNRNVATSPNSDMLQEMRIETSNFDASVGHGTGLGVSMMTKAGTNRYNGSAAYQTWTSKLNGANHFQRPILDNDPYLKEVFESGKSNNLSLTIGGPLTIPALVKGQNKLFFFANYSYVADLIPGNIQGGATTIPASEAHLRGDFSDLLLLPNPQQYRIYDPLSVRPDPDRPGRVKRDPFPNNIIPANRIVNPMYPLYTQFLPAANQNPTSPGLAPTDNYLGAAEPDQTHSHLWGGRIDYNLSDKDRVFFRFAGSYFTEEDDDWTYANPLSNNLHATWRLRKSWSYTGNWTRAFGATVIDTNIASNWFLDSERRLGLKRYKPTDFGFPQYVDEFCAGRTGGCQMPQVQIAGYQTFGGPNVGVYPEVLNVQGQVNVTHVRGNHTLRFGTDNRNHLRKLPNLGNTSPVVSYTNQYTRPADDTVVFGNPANLGLSWAAFMMGIPTSISVDNLVSPDLQSPYFSVYGQDSWRASRNLTLNFGLRWEYENGIREANGRDIVGWDPEAITSITALAEAAYAASPNANRPASTFKVRGGPLFATDPATNGRSWKGQHMWMPRFSGAYRLGSRTVIKGGYGMFYDTLNASTYGPLTTGFSATSNRVTSNDFGVNWALGNPKAGILPQQDPFPVRADGTRYDLIVGDSLGLDSLLGNGITISNPDREHPRVQRYRASVQRELWRTSSIEVAYNFQIGDRLSMTRREDYLPEEYWNKSNVRDLTQQNLLQTNVTNPFRLSVFAPLQQSNPALYSRLQNNAFFTASTVQLNRLLRGPYPQYNGINFSNLPIGENRTHGVEVNFTRRFSKGWALSAAYSGNRIRNLEFLNEYDREPTLWQPNANGRPHRFTASGLAEIPFGTGRKYGSGGGVLAAIFGGWQLGGTVEYQPGPLLTWGNVFFYGDFGDIASDNPTLERWFNVDAGFERDPAKTPVNFQARVFPFRIDGVRGPNLLQLNGNVMRTIALGDRRVFSFRVDIINFPNRTTFANPNVTPTATDFGRITGATAASPRFVQFVSRLTF